MSVTTNFLSNTPRPAPQTDVGINVSKPGYSALSAAGSNLIYSSSWPTLQYPFEINYSGENVVPNTPYKFSVSLSSTQTVSANTWTKVSLNTVAFDTGSNFDAVTNHQFTAPVTGYYLFCATAEPGASSTNTNQLGLNVGSFSSSPTYVLAGYSPGNGLTQAIGGTIFVLLSVNQTAQLYAYCASTSLFTNTSLQGFLVSS